MCVDECPTNSALPSIGTSRTGAAMTGTSLKSSLIAPVSQGSFGADLLADCQIAIFTCCGGGIGTGSSWAWFGLAFFSVGMGSSSSAACAYHSSSLADPPGDPTLWASPSLNPSGSTHESSPAPCTGTHECKELEAAPISLPSFMTVSEGRNKLLHALSVKFNCLSHTCIHSRWQS